MPLGIRPAQSEGFQRRRTLPTWRTLRIIRAFPVGEQARGRRPPSPSFAYGRPGPPAAASMWTALPRIMLPLPQLRKQTRRSPTWAPALSALPRSRGWPPEAVATARSGCKETKGGRISMELGMVGLGRMGANMAERLLRGGHRVVGYD